jgi:hypothetical protein
MSHAVSHAILDQSYMMPHNQRQGKTCGFWKSPSCEHLIFLKVPRDVRRDSIFQSQGDVDKLGQLDLSPDSSFTEERSSVSAEKEIDVRVETIVQCHPSSNERSLASLPPEIILSIVDYLPPVDRICLALTCRSLFSSTLPALTIATRDWARSSGRRLGHLISQRPRLYVRLAHGWLPKDKFRYCGNCYKILPRFPDYFEERLRRKKKPRFDGRVRSTGVTEKEWRSMSKSTRYSHLVDDWCHTSREDSSALFCNYCCHTVRDWCRFSVHCPLCLEKDLTYRPRKKRWNSKALFRWLINVWKSVEILAYWTFLWGARAVHFVYVQVRPCWRACTGCCGSRRAEVFEPFDEF